MEIALRLRNCLQPEDFLARSGGDEFLILLDHLQDLSLATRLAESINKELACPFLLDGYEVAVSASIGIAYSSHQDGHVDLLRDVDAAMYKAKAMGKSCYAVFNRQMHTKAVSRLQIETDLHQALEQKNFVLYYQPQTKLYSGELVGVEALIRLCHPQQGLMSPVDFIPVLEDTGIIVTLGEWILRTACHQLRAWQNAGLLLDHVSVNVSALQFRNHQRLFQVVAECLEMTGLSPECLELELTETLLLEDTDSAIKTLARFKDMGIGVTIDDFGTGYASLNYLKRFPADALKIDRSFIQGVMSVPTDAAITVATIDMAHALGLTVVAEGVETADQRDFLRDHGCDWAQGYFYSAPLEESAFLRWAKQYNRMMKNKL
jgi:EAL domain-containing protein (putative c-di-GMP-specific phosphodiesterase class I)